MKKNKIILIGVLIIVSSIFSWVFTMTDSERWLLMNRGAAEEYAATLMSGDTSYPTPDKFIDYVISAKKDYVIFTEHNKSNRTFGFFSNGLTNVHDEEVKKIEWIKIEDNWYLARY